MMEVHATGWNAWNQLSFVRSDDRNDEPEDIRKFTCVLRDEAIRDVVPYFSHTIVDTKSGIRVAGLEPEKYKSLHKANTQAHEFAEASNGVVAALSSSGLIAQYPDMTSWHSRSKCTIFSEPRGVTQIVAYEAGFAALTRMGQVWTWGDARYDACLAREVSEKSPADEPGLVTALVDLPTGPIAKVVAGGYVVAALTSGKDLYCWGGHPARESTLRDLTGDPNPATIEDQDVVDVAIGAMHMLVLTADGAVFGIGDNQNGQLGFGLDVRSVDSWTRVKLKTTQDQDAIRVAAGLRNSFIVIRNNH